MFLDNSVDFAIWVRAGRQRYRRFESRGRQYATLFA